MLRNMIFEKNLNTNNLLHCDSNFQMPLKPFAWFIKLMFTQTG